MAGGTLIESDRNPCEAPNLNRMPAFADPRNKPGAISEMSANAMVARHRLVFRRGVLGVGFRPEVVRGSRVQGLCVLD